MKIPSLRFFSSPATMPRLDPTIELLLTKIAQLAIRAFFCFTMLLMADALVPLCCREIILVGVALSSSFLAASFFQKESDEAAPIAVVVPLSRRVSFVL